MSEPKLISPMLDAFQMGGPISDHDGVRCCPAMRNDSNEKYIVKIISVPASQTKLDALLLTGAYPDKEAALEYFKELADGIIREKKILDDLAQLEGFVGFEDCQIVPMDDATGYEVYLLSPYRMTLSRAISKSPMTQLGAVNLGLDLCAALATCRRSGYLCVDIKPSNIILTGDKEYCIGDLGFTDLNSLQFASLPDKYRSNYTAPEVEDAFSALTNSMDIFAVGMVLYQIYNNGELPYLNGEYPDGELSAPVFADEEIAQIILKAIAKNPEDRWQDPAEMGHALVNYMQKNGVNDTPLTKEFFGEEENEAIEESEADLEDLEIEVQETVDAEEIIESVEQEESVEDSVVEESVEAAPIEISSEENVEVAEDDFVAAITEAIAVETDEIPETAVVIETTDNIEEAEQELPAAQDVPPESTETEEEYDNLSFLEDESIEVDYDAVPDDVSEMLEHIDELAAHQIPEPPVAPEPVEIKLPEPEVSEEVEEEVASIEASEESAVVTAEPDEAEEEIPDEEKPYTPKKKRTGLIWCIVLLIIAALGIGGYFFYQTYYLQPIHTLTLDGAEDRLTVQLTADIDETYLTIICADSHGNKIPAPVVGGTAVFTGLAPDTAYTVSVEVDGFHKLTGITSKVYSTPLQTQIVQFSAITGSENGSVVLSFAVEGPDSNQWNVIYSADGEAERVTAFPDHMVTLTGLTVGKEYTFRLEPVDEIFISGNTEIAYVAKDLICAANLHVVSCIDGMLTAQWDVPAGYQVEQWTVRCYNESGYDETIHTADTTVTFEGIDDSLSYTVDVTAEFMSVNQRVIVSANSITVTDFTVDSSSADVIVLNWNANREIPAEGWTIRYSVDGISAAQNITTTRNSVQIASVPGGEYQFTILDGVGNAVLGGPFVHNQLDATEFSAFDVKASDLTLRLCCTPSESTWSYKDLEEDDYVNSFSVGQKISAVVALSGEASRSDDNVLTTFAIYDDNGKLVNFSHSEQTWRSMWYENYCELDITSIPVEQGNYNLVIYFNGQAAGSQKFEITT